MSWVGCHGSCVIYLGSGISVRCQVSHFTCHKSSVTCRLSYVTKANSQSGPSPGITTYRLNWPIKNININYLHLGYLSHNIWFDYMQKNVVFFSNWLKLKWFTGALKKGVLWVFHISCTSSFFSSVDVFPYINPPVPSCCPGAQLSSHPSVWMSKWDRWDETERLVLNKGFFFFFFFF